MKKIITVILLTLLIFSVTVPETRVYALEVDSGGENAWHILDDDTYYVHFRSYSRSITNEPLEKETGFTGRDGVEYDNWNESYNLHSSSWGTTIPISAPNETHNILVIRTFTFNVEIDDNGTAVYTANSPVVVYKNSAKDITIDYTQYGTYHTWAVTNIDNNTEIFRLAEFENVNFEISWISSEVNDAEWQQNTTDGYWYFNIPLYLGLDMQYLVSVPDHEFLELMDFGTGEYSQILDDNNDFVKTLSVEYIRDGEWLDIIINVGDKKITTSVVHQRLIEKPSLIYDILSIRKLISILDIPDNLFSNVSDLPETESTSNIGVSNLGNVTYTVENNYVMVTINYRKVYRLKYRFDAGKDMSIFDSIESYYINAGGSNPQLIINHSDRPYLKDILINSDETPAFVPHSIWNLKTNDINTVLKYTTYSYIKQNNKGVIISYVYTDAFIIDNILSTTLSWTSRTKYNFPNSLWAGQYSEWETRQETLTSDEYLNYHNKTSDWQDIIPIWNLARGLYKTFKTYHIPKINSVNIDTPQDDYNVTRKEVEGYFQSINADMNFNVNDKYKLWAFALEEGFDYFGLNTEFYHNDTNPSDPRNFNIIEIRYETNGKMYVTEGKDMDLEVIIDDKIDGINNEAKRKQNIRKAIFIGAVALGVFLAVKMNAFKSMKHFIQFIATVAIFAAAIYLLWNYFFISIPIRLVLRI